MLILAARLGPHGLVAHTLALLPHRESSRSPGKDIRAGRPDLGADAEKVRFGLWREQAVDSARPCVGRPEVAAYSGHRLAFWQHGLTRTHTPSVSVRAGPCSSVEQPCPPS